MQEKEHIIIGTSGHIDHGKSALVKALTGIDPDTLPEEKERGLTIELGFVFMEAPDYEKQIVFIDVPGHEKFIKTMAAGANSLDAVLLVIAADEGICVQTREHFDILRLLGVELGLVVLAKSDLVSPEQVRELTFKINNFVKGTFLQDAPIVPVSAVTGVGLDELKAQLLAIGRKVKMRTDSGIFRMPIDRVFTIHGFGTVIAGTILSGEIRVGDGIEIFPEKIEAKVRGIQVHNEKKEKSGIGKHTALNLQDIKKELLRRGQCAAARGSLFPTIRLDARLDLLKSHGNELKNRERVRLHLGTEEVIARMVLLERGILKPGESSFVQFVCESPTVALPGDRFVIRSFSPLMTIGGGVILDGAPEKHKREDPRVIEEMKNLQGTPAEVIEQMFLQAEFLPQSTLAVAMKSGKAEAIVRSVIEQLLTEGKIIRVAPDKGGQFLHSISFKTLSENLLTSVGKYFESYPHRLFMPVADLRSQFLKRSDAQAFKSVLDELLQKNLLTKKDQGIGLTGREVRFKPKDLEIAGRIERVYRSGRFETPLEDDVERELGLKPEFFREIMGSLLQQGKLVRLNKKVTYHQETIAEARQLVLDYILKKGGITIAELRDKLSLSRKFAQALLEYFDLIGLTSRRDDRHVLK